MPRVVSEMVKAGMLSSGHALILARVFGETKSDEQISLALKKLSPRGKDLFAKAFKAGQENGLLEVGVHELQGKIYFLRPAWRERLKAYYENREGEAEKMSLVKTIFDAFKTA
ncbi:MAG: hypothetical protein ACP5O3_02170 [Candidatus Micrarchaeia archaeon]